MDDSLTCTSLSCPVGLCDSVSRCVALLSSPRVVVRTALLVVRRLSCALLLQAACDSERLPAPRTGMQATLLFRQAHSSVSCPVTWQASFLFLAFPLHVRLYFVGSGGRFLGCLVGVACALLIGPRCAGQRIVLPDITRTGGGIGGGARMVYRSAVHAACHADRRCFFLHCG